MRRGGMRSMRCSPDERYSGNSVRLIPLNEQRTGSSRKTKPACAAEPNEFTAKRSKSLPPSFSLASLKMRSLKTAERAGKNIDAMYVAA